MPTRPLVHCLARSRVGHLRWLATRNTRNASSWAQNAALPSSKVQVYTSETHDPYLNLSIEHYLLTHSPPASAILFLYINRPCIVIGRNQNPWLETNLNILDAAGTGNALETEPAGLGQVDLVRRRSGGGAVFHDQGNVNWTVISPSEGFTRDKHAEMIVRALRRLGVDRARVNKRHDIVLDKGQERGPAPSANDMHATPWTVSDTTNSQTVKVSGSAYKLTRGRALHHGTCLLSSPNLQVIPHYLHSPAKPFIKAKGVESVSSPVNNIGLGTGEFQDAVLQEFSAMYPGATINTTLGDNALDEAAVREGWNELQTPEWMFSQTPQFTFTAGSTGDDTLLQSTPQNSGPLPLNVSLDFRHGRVTDGSLSLLPAPASSEDATHEEFLKVMQGRSLWENWHWDEVLNEMFPTHNAQVIEHAGKWLQNMLPTNLGRYTSRRG